MQLNINKKLLIEKILTCLEPTEVSRPYTFFMRDGISVRFGRKEAEAYRDARSILLNFGELTDKYSAKTITAGFQSLLVKLLTGENGIPSEEEIKQELDVWLTEMITTREYEFTYFVVIENLKIYRDLKIGEVKLEPLSEENVHKLIDEIHALIDANRYYADKKKKREFNKQAIKEDILSQFRPKERSTLMSTKLFVRDVAKEFEVANKRFRDVLHLLRFLGVFIYARGRQANIGLRGELAWGHTAYLALSDDGGWKINMSVAGYLFEFDISYKNLETFKKLELDTFGEILSKQPDERTELEKRLMNSIIWASKALSDSSEDNQFVQLCIAVENLLGGDEREGITRILAERLALLLEDERDRRIEIFDKAMKIFKIRGEIIHAGSPKKDSELLEYLPFITGYTCQAIILTTKLMTEHSWKKFTEFANHLQLLKFT